MYVCIDAVNIFTLFYIIKKIDLKISDK